MPRLHHASCLSIPSAVAALLSTLALGCADPAGPVMYNGFTTSDTDYTSDASDAANDPDASDASDASREDADASGPRCDELRADYAAALDAATTCTDDDDCKVVGGTGTCDCAHTWGAASGDAVNQSFALPADWDARVVACSDFIADLERCSK